MQSRLFLNNRPLERGELWFRITFSVTVIAVAVFALILIFLLKSRTEEVPAQGEPVINVKVETVAALPELADTLDLPAVVEPNYVVCVSAEVAGRIEKILCKEGTPCKKGDLLMTLNTDLLQASFDRAQAQVEQDDAQYERIKKLHAGGAVTEQDLERATAALAVSRATLSAAQAELERASITAPNSGILNDLPVEEGEYVQPGTPVGEIVDVATVKVAVQTPEKDVPHVRIGDKASVIARINDETREIESTVSFIDEVADPDTRSTRVEMSVDNRDNILRSGQIVRVRLTRRVIPDAILVPLLAVIPFENSKAVYVVEDGKAVRREVTLGIIRGTRIQILDGLQPGDQLIVAGHRFVGPEQGVRIIEEGVVGPIVPEEDTGDTEPEDAAQ